VGSLGKGSVFEVVSNISVNGAIFNGTQNGVRIKTWEGGKGAATNLTFQNIKMKDTNNPIIIDQYYCPHDSCSTQVLIHFTVISASLIYCCNFLPFHFQVTNIVLKFVINTTVDLYGCPFVGIWWQRCED